MYQNKSGLSNTSGVRAKLKELRFKFSTDPVICKDLLTFECMLNHDICNRSYAYLYLNIIIINLLGSLFK